MFLCDLTLPTPEENLACDEALLDLCEAGGAGELLRFWEPPSYFVVLGYANNLPLEGARDNFGNWNQWRLRYSPLVGREILGLGLSDQSWTCWDEAACPISVLINWAQRALDSGAIVLEIEPIAPEDCLGMVGRVLLLELRDHAPAVPAAPAPSRLRPGIRQMAEEDRSAANSRATMYPPLD